MTVRPYDEEQLLPYETVHATIPARQVDPRVLRATQPVVVIDRLLTGDTREGPDPCLHVVEFDGDLWVHDGHHRWARAWLRGDPTVAVRCQPGVAA